MDLPDGNGRLTKCGVFYKPDIEEFIEYYSDANFDGVWAHADANSIEHAISRTEYKTPLRI